MEYLFALGPHVKDKFVEKWNGASQLQQFGSLTVCEQNVPCEIFTKFSWKIGSTKIINCSIKNKTINYGGFHWVLFNHTFSSQKNKNHAKSFIKTAPSCVGARCKFDSILFTWMAEMVSWFNFDWRTCMQSSEKGN
jgi:hypothetical protein